MFSTKLTDIARFLDDTSSPTSELEPTPAFDAGFSLRSSPHGTAPRQALPFDAFAVQALQTAQSLLQGNERHGEGDGLARVIAPNGERYLVKPESLDALELQPYGNGTYKVAGTGVGLSGGARGQRGARAGRGRGRGRGTGRTSDTASAGMRRVRSTETEATQQAEQAPRLRRPRTQQAPVLDPALLQAAEQQLDNYLRGLTQPQIDALAPRFGALQVRESDISAFRGSPGARSAVINAANDQLGTGEGVNGAIQLAAGPELAQWGARQRAAAVPGQSPCPTGTATTSPGFDMDVDHIIHAVGPQVQGTPSLPQEQQLRSSYRIAYAEASHHRVSELGVSALSTGIYGYPVESAGAVMMTEALEALRTQPRLGQLQLTSMQPSGASDLNFQVLSHLWTRTRDHLQANASRGTTLIQTAPVPRSAATAAGASSTAPAASTSTAPSAAASSQLFPRHAQTGLYSIHAQHVSQPIRTYHPPQQGYHHEVQQYTNCGMHVLQQQLMFYTGNDHRQLASQADFDQHVRNDVLSTVLPQSASPEQEIGQRQANQQFDDLAAFSNGQFRALLGAVWNGDGTLTLPTMAQDGHTPPTAAEIDAMPAVGVTMVIRSRSGEPAQHSTQIVQLQADARGRPRFIEVDPARDPRDPNQQPRRLRGSTMTEAIQSLIYRAHEDQLVGSLNLGRQFDLLVPTQATLQAYGRLMLPLPLPQTPPPRPTIAVVATGTTGTTGTTKTSNAATVLVRAGSPLPDPAGERPGIEQPTSEWVGPFLRADANDELDVLLAIADIPDDGLPLVRHYAGILWNQLGIYAHTPHFSADNAEGLVGSSRVDLQACKLEYSIVSPK